MIINSGSEVSDVNTDYSRYTLTYEEQVKFFLAGYFFFFFLGFIFYRSIGLSIAAGFTVLLFKKRYEAYRCEKRKEMLILQFRELLYILSACVSTGKSMAEGMKEALERLEIIYKEDAPIIKELEIITKGIYENRDSEVRLLKDFAVRSSCADIVSFVDVYLSVREAGGDMVKVINKTADIISDKITIEKEIETIISQKKAEAKLITAMPIVIIAGLNITASGYIDPLYETLTGRIVMTLSLAGMCGAYVLADKITRINV